LSTGHTRPEKGQNVAPIDSVRPETADVTSARPHPT
jgi:hypothetical protein